MWTDEITGKQVYGSNGCGDRSANGMYEAAKVKGNINTLPEVPGIMLHMDYHAGIYIGNGEVIEARGFNYGVVLTKLKDRKWLHWYQLPGLKYVTGSGESTPQSAPAITVKPVLTKGATGQYVVELQKKLLSLGYSLPIYGADGDFGTETYNAVIAFQKASGLVVDGEVGKNTWAALDKPTTAPANPMVKPVGTFVVKGGTWNVRKTASTSGAIIGYAKGGEIYLLTGGKSDNWFEIEYKNTTGWISGSAKQ